LTVKSRSADVLTTPLRTTTGAGPSVVTRQLTSTGPVAIARGGETRVQMMTASLSGSPLAIP